MHFGDQRTGRIEYRESPGLRLVLERARDDLANLFEDLFDRRIGKTLSDSVVRLILATGTDRPAVPYSEIAGIAFTGRDTAAGKSYEAWVKKYWESRAKGEKNISLEPESLE